MRVTVTLVSENALIRRLVHDFSRGLGCPVEIATGHSVRIQLDDVDQRLVELLTHVALGATKAGVDLAEPICHVTYRHEGATSDVTLSLRISDVRIDTIAKTGA